jgi:S1-C subfamily serine protease
VLDRENDITVQTHDKRTLSAQFVGRDSASDLAILRVNDLNGTLAVWANDEVRVGQLIMTVGRSNSEGAMASVGIVSAVGGPLRTNQGTTLERYIRTDAIPYPGFSGGALIDLNGAVVGLLTTGLANGVAIAVPANIAKGIADTLVAHGTIKRGYLGISSQLVDIPAGQRSGREQEHGLLIVKVEENSPAQKGGVLIGDILVSLAGHAIKDSEDLHTVLVGDYVGKAIPVEVIRGNAIQALQVTVGQRQ